MDAMTLWEKLTSDPDRGPRIRSPLPAGIAGVMLIFITLRSIVEDRWQLGKGPNPRVIHFEDHPKTFILACVAYLLLGAGALWYARRQFLRHRGD
jgi:hypothetical protein